MTNYIYSTMSAGTAYTFHDYDIEKNPLLRKSILIKGGSGVALPSKRGGGEKGTPFGVKTEVSDDELALLKEHSTFMTQMEAGFLRIESTNKEPEKVASKMTARDKSAPKTPETDKESNLPIAKLEAV